MLNQLKNYNTVWLFISYCFLFVAATYLVQFFLITDSLIHSSYTEQLSYDRIEELIDAQNKYAWVGYIVLPLIYALKFFLVANCLLAGSLFFDIKLKFSEAFKIALLADIVFIIPLLIKIFWFILVQKDYSLQDLQQFYPLSLLNFFAAKEVSILWIYPLQTLNAFELLYIFSLGYWVCQFGAKNYEKGLNMVLITYVPALFMWVVLVMFITVNLNPNA